MAAAAIVVVAATAAMAVQPASAANGGGASNNGNGRRNVSYSAGSAPIYQRGVQNVAVNASGKTNAQLAACKRLSQRVCNVNQRISAPSSGW
ncbi:hypothetical protein [Microbispora sp. NBRC 16548]|uniref:hypothetical protein n=1 Tax=Microbispora sp. NBRC 16548 TaxID=3030994 RepID=UPI00255664CF|nr:hypothetical protein [Microbispora sp. NBRC 16548]